MYSLSEALVAALGSEKVMSDRDALARYCADGLRPSRAYPALAQLTVSPLAAVRPQSTAEVAQVVRLAQEYKTPLVPYGGGTGLMGGALALQPSIVIDLTAMNRILSINPLDRTATVESGVILADLERELNRHRLILGHDPWSLPIATVGGAIATDGLGYRALRYGSMGDQVLGMVVVLPDGRVLETRAVPRHSTGIDLNRLFIGAEGCLGVVTEVTLRVFPQPEQREIRAYSFDDFEAGFAAIMDMFAVGLRPAMIDFGEGYSVPGLKRRGSPIRSMSKECTLYVAFEGCREEVQAQIQRTATICVQRGGRDQGRREALRFWNTRHRAAERYARNRLVKFGERLAATVAGLRLDYIHVCIPAGKVLEYRRACQAVMERHQVQPVEYGIWCQPELFSVVMVKASLARSRSVENMAVAIDEMLQLANAMGGSMEYCHGVGIRLAHLMEQEHGVGLSVMQAIKAALDPHRLMNPNKLGL